MLDSQLFLSESNPNINLLITNKALKINLKTTLPLTIHPSDWNAQKQRPENIYLKKNKSLNNSLNALKIALCQCAEERIKTQKKITPRILKQIIDTFFKEEQTEYAHKKESLLYWMQHYIDQRKDCIKNNTLKRYKVFLQFLKRFEGHQSRVILPEEVDTGFAQAFIRFGKNEDYCESTIHRTLDFIKTILRYISKKGIPAWPDLIAVRKPKQMPSIVTLSETELEKIDQTQVPKALQAAKEWLLISCYTGQRISDFMQFSTKQFEYVQGKPCLSFVQQKTQKPILLPLHPKIAGILQHNNNHFPPAIDAATYNKQIKQIAQIARINDVLHTRKRQGFRSYLKKIEKWEAISSHIGRRSFATNFYGKIPTTLLMQATGHSSEQMFMRYINPFDQDKTIALGRYFDGHYD